MILGHHVWATLRLIERTAALYGRPAG